MTQAIGLLGGTFDPVHHGHLRLAEELGEALGLDEVRLLPTGTPPHRGQPQAAAQHRLEMVKLAVADNPRFRVDEHEIHRRTPCYMVDTLSQLRVELGEQRPLILFLGADAFAKLDTWHEWRQLFTLVHLAITQRPGYPDFPSALPTELAEVWHARHVEQPQRLHETPAGCIYQHAVTQLDISASHLRRLIATRASIRYLLPDTVQAYLDRHHLYR